MRINNILLMIDGFGNQGFWSSQILSGGVNLKPESRLIGMKILTSPEKFWEDIVQMTGFAKPSDRGIYAC